MAPVTVTTSPATLQRVERAAGELSSGATRRMETAHDWYRALSAEDRSWVGLVAQAGIAAFIAWLREGGDHIPVTADVSGTAPRELTRSITLRQTLDLVRSVVDVVEQDATALVPALHALDRLPSKDKRHVLASFAALHRPAR